MSKRRIANLSSIFTFTLLAGCAVDGATDESIETAAAESPPEWRALGAGCADTIAVGPNDVPWVTGCDGRPDNSVWYMRYEWECIDGFCNEVPVWYHDNFSAARVVVDNKGDVVAVTAAGLTWGARWMNPEGSDIAVPNGDWSRAFALDCVNQLAGYNLTDNGVLAFETPDRRVSDDTERYLSTICNADLNGNSAVRYIRNYRGDRWLPANGSGQLLATFYRPVGSFPQVTFVTSAANGTMWAHDESDVEFYPIESPPSPTYSLTDHFAATDDGVYRYDDATGEWTRHIGNITRTGWIKQIAHAGATRVVYANGSEGIVGPSSLWGIDDSGEIYYASTIDTPR